MTENQKKQLNHLLNEIGKALDVTKTEYETITTSYKAVGNYLAEENSPLWPYKPQIRPQGSFLFGTAVRPVAEDGDLDVDLVCELTRKPASWTQQTTKNAVGNRLKESKVYKDMLDKEGKRCWTLKYADNKYHMDILPCFVSDDYPNAIERMLIDSSAQITDTTAIRITDNTLLNYAYEKNTDHWLKSNPFGLAKWFYMIAFRPTSLRHRINLKEDIAPIPRFDENKSTLQRAIQLMKRHRDMMFIHDDTDKPTSIIITTLAARSYDDSVDLLDAITHIAGNMTSYIKGTPGHRVVENPVNPSENFADRWTSNNRKERNFYSWVARLQHDIKRIQLSTGCGQDAIKVLFDELFGEKISKASFSAYANYIANLRNTGKLTVSSSAATLGTSAGASVPKHNFYGRDE